MERILGVPTYTLVEELDDTVIKTQYYDNDDGNRAGTKPQPCA